MIKYNIITDKMDYRLMNISDKLMHIYSEFENLLRETLLSKIVVRNLRKENIINLRDEKYKIQKMPFWKVIISSYVCDVIDKEKFKEISELKKKLKIFGENFNVTDDILKEQKMCYTELVRIVELLTKKNEELRKEWKETLNSIIAK